MKKSKNELSYSEICLQQELLTLINKANGIDLILLILIFDNSVHRLIFLFLIVYMRNKNIKFSYILHVYNISVSKQITFYSSVLCALTSRVMKMYCLLSPNQGISAQPLSIRAVSHYYNSAHVRYEINQLWKKLYMFHPRKGLIHMSRIFSPI